MSILDRLTAGQYENSLPPQTQFVCVVGGVGGGGRGARYIPKKFDH